MGSIFSVKGGGPADYWLLPVYFPTRVAAVTLRLLEGIDEVGSPVVTRGRDPVQHPQTGPLFIPFETLGGPEDGVELLFPQVKRSDPDPHGGPPPFFNVWAKVWAMGKDTVHVRVDSDQRGIRQVIGWVSFLRCGARWLAKTNGDVLIQLQAQPKSKVVVRF